MDPAESNNEDLLSSPSKNYQIISTCIRCADRKPKPINENGYCKSCQQYIDRQPD